MKRRVKFKLCIVRQGVNQYADAWAIYNPRGLKFASRLSDAELAPRIRHVAEERAGFTIMRSAF